MKKSTETRILTALEAIASHLARVLPVEPEIPTVPATPSKPPVPMRDRVSVVLRGRPQPEDSMGVLTSGGKDPARFWAEPDPYAGELARPARHMGRRVPVTR